MRTLKLILVLSLAATATGLVACGPNTIEDQFAEEETDIRAWLSTNGIDGKKTARDLYYYPITENPDGASVPSDAPSVVDVHYKMWLLDRDLFVASTSPGTDSAIRTGIFQNTTEPPGIELGLALMKEGETLGLIIPSKLGYGSLQLPGIPPFSILRMEVTLEKVWTEETLIAEEDRLIEAYLAERNITEFTKTENGLYYVQKEEGTGDLPTDGNVVSVTYTGTYLDGVSFDSGNFSVTLGAGQVIAGFEEGIKLTKNTGSAKIIMPSRLGYGASTMVFPHTVPNSAIAPFTPLVFDIEVTQ